MAARFSHQREQVYQAVAASRDHPTAEMVYAQLKPDMPLLSLGTVYRNLRQLVQEKRLREIGGPVTRYDGNTAPHTHLCCGCCGSVADLEAVSYDDSLDRQVAAPGWQVAGHTLVFNGLCPDCMKEHSNF